MAGQGRYLTEYQIATIVRLLSSTDTALVDIAQRFGCTKSTVAAINRKNAIRMYNGRRTHWNYAEAVEQGSAQS